MSMRYASLYLLLTLSFTSCMSPTPSARTAYTNATIWTGNEQAPWAEALLIEDNKIVAVGSRIVWLWVLLERE